MKILWWYWSSSNWFQEHDISSNCNIFAPSILENFKSTPCKLAYRKSALVKSAPSKLASIKIAYRKSALVKFAPLKLALWKLAQYNFISVKLVFVQSARYKIEKLKFKPVISEFLRQELLKSLPT